jgi:DNA polymerase III delta prime subunit
MQQLINQKENLHHAYLIEGEREGVISKLLFFFEKELNFQTQNNPDFWQGEYDTFGIDEGRYINELQNKKSFSEGKQIFVIQTNFITREAQNSLLKMFEEPTPNTHFFIVMSSGEVLLPTLKSRLQIIKKRTSNVLQNEEVKNFLKMSVGDRLKFVSKFFGDNKKKIPADKIGAINFLNQLEKTLREKTDIAKATPEQIFAFEEIIKARSYLNDRSPSVKNLMEHISLILS